MPDISVIIPSFNGERFFSETIESLALQENANFEIILSDGGSTDNTVEIAKTVDFAPIKICSAPDRGIPHALNRGFDLAEAPILCWLNADDVYLSPNTLATAINSLRMPRNSKKAAFSYGNCAVLDEFGRLQKRLVAFSATPKNIGLGANIFTGSLFFTRDAWRAFGGFSEEYQLAFEYELLKDLFLQSEPILIKKYLAGFRVHNCGLSTVHRERMRQEREAIFGYGTGRKIRFSRISAQLADGTLMETVRNRILQPGYRNHWRTMIP